MHDGYFSIDKNKRWTDTAENNQVNRDSAERAYNLIMKDKEKLLGFGTKRIHLLAFGAEGRLGQPQRVPDLCLTGDGDRT